MIEKGRLPGAHLGQNLLFHPQLHCVVTGGGLAPDGNRWIASRQDGGGKPMTKSTLHYLLSNVTYCGRVRHKEDTFAGEHEAIIAPRTWERVQRLLEQEGNGRGVEYDASAALLKGLLFCQPCGAAMVPTHSWARGKKYHYYVCSNKQKRSSQACACPALPATETEAFVLEQVRITCGGMAASLAGPSINGEQASLLRRVLRRIDCDGKRFALAFVADPDKHKESR